MSEPDRRTLIADAAIEIVAEQGVRALTHRAVDTRLGLPTGSTSFYVRTKAALLDSTVQRLAERAREDFQDSMPERLGHSDIEPDPAAAAEVIAVVLDRVLDARRHETITRYALALEGAGGDSLRAALARSAFSLPQAVELFRGWDVPEPEAAGADMVSLCEGLVFDRVVGIRSLEAPAAGSSESIGQLARAIETYLRGVLAR